MPREWQLQEAKNKFSEVVERAIEEGPQHITRRGKDAAVVVSAKDFSRMKRGKESLVAFFRRAPLKGLDLQRAKDLPRNVDL